MAGSKIGFIEQVYKNTKNYRGVIFLDRDGTINVSVENLRSKADLKPLPDVARGIRLLNKERVAVIVITNQPAVARGDISIRELKEINDGLVEILKKEDANIDAIYSCPHHPETHHADIPEKSKKYRFQCECRKPGAAMCKRAISIYKQANILGVVGDQTRDIQMGKDLGVPTVALRTGYNLGDGTYDVAADFTCDSLLDAIKVLLQKTR